MRMSVIAILKVFSLCTNTSFYRIFLGVFQRISSATGHLNIGVMKNQEDSKV